MLYWMLMDMYLPKFDTYQGTVAPSCFKSHLNSRCPGFFQKKVYLVSGLKFTSCDITSVLAESLSCLQKLYSGLYEHRYTVRASTAPKNCFINYCSLNLEKKPPNEVYKISCSKKFCNIQRKTPVL